MKIEAHIMCWNEMAIAPFVMDYWCAAGVDRLVVHDNCSDDGVTDYLRQFPFVQIERYNSGGLLDDYRLQSIKNNCWKGSDADWVFVGDFDEVPFHPSGLKKALAKYENVSALQACGYQLLSWSMPIRTTLCHNCYGVRLHALGANKTHFLRPYKVREMHWGLGAHQCNPEGASVQYVPNISWFHLKDLGVEYLLERNRQLYDRLPEKVKQERKIAVHYLPGMDVHNVAREMADAWAHSVRSKDIVL